MGRPARDRAARVDALRPRGLDEFVDPSLELVADKGSRPKGVEALAWRCLPLRGAKGVGKGRLSPGPTYAAVREAFSEEWTELCVE